MSKNGAVFFCLIFYLKEENKLDFNTIIKLNLAYLKLQLKKQKFIININRN